MKRKQQVYYLGYIPDSLADEAGIMGGSIFVDNRALKHIGDTHRRELAQLGMSAMEFVSAVASGYTEIRQGSDNSILLIIRKRPNRVLAIRLHCLPVLHFYEVATAFPLTDDKIKNYGVIYKK